MTAKCTCYCLPHASRHSFASCHVLCSLNIYRSENLKKLYGTGQLFAVPTDVGEIETAVLHNKDRLVVGTLLI